MKLNAGFLQWVSAELFFIFSVISAVMFGVFSGSLSTSMHIPAAELGWLSGVFFIVYAFTQFYSGRLFVIFPAKQVMLVSAIIAGVGSLLFSCAQGIGTLFLARVLLGVGLAATFVGVLFVIQNNFNSQTFPLMSSLSQSIANCCAGVFGMFASVIVAKYSFRIPFGFLSAGFIGCAILILIFFKNTPQDTTATAKISLWAGLKSLTGNTQVWLAAIYFSGLFGAILTFADLFNVAFQVEAFHVTYPVASIINSMIPFGLTIGGLVAGYIAKRLNNYVLPARVMGLLAVLMFAVLIWVRFNTHSVIYIMLAVSFAFGVGCSGSILAFQCVQKNVPDASLRPLATSFVLTFSYMFSGLLEQPLVGNLIGATSATAWYRFGLAGYSWLFSPSIHDAWNKYNYGLIVVLITLMLSFVASLFFKQQEN